MNIFTAAAIQLDTKSNAEENLHNAVELIREAAERGARLIAMPETVNYIGPEYEKFAECIPEGHTFKVFAEQAKKYRVWLHCGSIYEKNEDANDRRPYNTTMIINPAGELAAKYRKLHPFDVTIAEGPVVRESDVNCPGNQIVTVDTGEVGHLGLSVCYDMRFCELFRIMALKGAQILIIPANFTVNTGKDHWEVLLRARAIENGCYVIAPGQIGIKPSYQAYGKTMIIDPWGNVVAMASDKTGVITAEIDLEYLQSVRSQVFTLENRRSDVYQLSER
ncbi:carbon-nitrogen hydrolase family protein [uncultured Robinsoniella sp.]|uniref:carbon-nitrogen hydrolase family protein n=1 Tax=uncultured Robinsoniella sp. TaxID=904190 RepID=UPI00374FD75E